MYLENCDSITITSTPIDEYTSVKDSFAEEIKILLFIFFPVFFKYRHTNPFNIIAIEIITITKVSGVLLSLVKLLIDKNKPNPNITIPINTLVMYSTIPY